MAGDRTKPEVAVTTGRLASGHPFARLGEGSRHVLSIPGLSVTSKPAKARSVRLIWRRWLPLIAAHDLTVWDVGRRGDFPTGTTIQDVADDYATVMQHLADGPMPVMGVSTGGSYAQWLAIRHPERVSRLLLAFTGARLTPESEVVQRQLADLAVSGAWRATYAFAARAFLPGPAPLVGALGWLLGPHLMGRPDPVDVLPIDTDAEERHDARPELGMVSCPTLIVAGSRDTLCPPYLSHELQAGIPGARLVVYEGAGHSGPGEPFARDACAFLAG